MAAHAPDKVLMRHLQCVYDAAEVWRPPGLPGLNSVDQLAQKVHVSEHFAVSMAVPLHKVSGTVCTLSSGPWLFCVWLSQDRAGG